MSDRMWQPVGRPALPARWLALAALVIGSVSCSDAPTAPIDVAGTERLAWDQRASSEAELGSFRFFIIIDGGERSELASVACEALGARSTAVCATALPPLSSGTHTLALQAVNPAGGESPRSSALSVSVTRPPAAQVSGPGVRNASGQGLGRAVRRADSPTLSVSPLATGLTDPTDLAVLPDGRILVAERRGQVQMASAGQPLQTVAQLDDVLAGERSALLALAVEPAFEQTRQIYLAYTTESGFQVARFREAAGRFVRAAVILDGVAASAQATAALRFSPDGLLHIALDDAGNPSTAGDLGSYNGKVLRVNADGTVPPDQAAYSPVIVANVSSARALAWAVADNRLWIAEGREPGTGVLDVVGPESLGVTRGQIVFRHRPPRGQVPSSLLAYRGRAIEAWTGDFLMALPDDAQIVRLTLSDDDRRRVAKTEVVLSGPLVGRVRAMALDGAGIVYLANDDRVLALAPTGWDSTR